MVDKQDFSCYKVSINKQSYSVAQTEQRERHTMKNTIATIALVAATATSAFANESASVQWTGTVADLENECVFANNVDGTMNYDDSVRTFYVDTPALIKVQQRGGAELLIESSAYAVREDASATGHNDYHVQVNYMQGDNPTVVTKSAGASAAKQDITADSSLVTAAKGDYNVGATLEVVSGWKGLDIELGGKAKLMYKDHLIENGDYAIQHTATCIQ